MLDREQLTSDLEVALHEGDVYAEFQPQIDLGSGAIVGAEGLCRWTHWHGFSVPPDMFVSLAEDNGSIHELGRFMLEQGLAAVAGWRTADSGMEVSVNVSPTQLLEASFVGDVTDRLRGFGLSPDALTMEITESVPLRDLESILPRLRTLRDLGVGVSLDDYGTGHASPNQFARLPLTEVKLDRSLIRNAGAGSTDSLHAVVELAHGRGLRVVAEGIETAQQMAFARELGCDRAQGFMLGAPMPRSGLDALLSD